MKKITGLLVAGLLLIGAGSVFANTTGSITLTGTVGDFMTMQVIPAAAASEIMLSVANSGLVVGWVVETSNVPYEITVSSANDFAFTGMGVDATGNPVMFSLDYSLFYNSVAVSTNGGVVSSGTLANNSQKAVSISYAAAGSDVTPGQYTDTLTFTIAAQ